MNNVGIIGIDISKRSFQLHGATADGTPMLRRKLSRGKVVEFLASQPPCQVVMETCGGVHHWGREIQQLGPEVRLIAPAYVKPFSKRRQKSDARDAAAIVEAAQRPTMRFVAVKTEQAQARSMLYRTRALLVQQRTQTAEPVGEAENSLADTTTTLTSGNPTRDRTPAACESSPAPVNIPGPHRRRPSVHTSTQPHAPVR